VLILEPSSFQALDSRRQLVGAVGIEPNARLIEMLRFSPSTKSSTALETKNQKSLTRKNWSGRMDLNHQLPAPNLLPSACRNLPPIVTRPHHGSNKAGASRGISRVTKDFRSDLATVHTGYPPAFRLHH
jgi:hypothetical protein